MKKKFILFGVLVLGLVAGGVFLLSRPSDGDPGKYNAFAQCLSEKGVIFYGAFWCPHCQRQKREFGEALKFVNYVECSTPDGKNQLEVCREASISAYPTWAFADGTRLEGEVDLQSLSQKTSCPLP